MFKNGDTSYINNSRPILILPSNSKIFEYVILHHLFDYLSHNALFCHEQYGFSTGHSTELASLQLTDYLVHHLIYIYIDLSKEFDTLDHSIIITQFSMESQAVRINFLSAICPTDINMLNIIMPNL